MCCELLFWTAEWHFLKGKLRRDQTLGNCFDNRNCSLFKAIYNVTFVSWCSKSCDFMLL
jgi:hypothetical protein